MALYFYFQSDPSSGASPQQQHCNQIAKSMTNMVSYFY